MRIVHYAGNGRRDQLLTLLAAMQAAHNGKLDVLIGPVDETLTAAYGVFIGGDNEQVAKLEELIKPALKALKADALPAEYVGEIE